MRFAKGNLEVKQQLGIRVTRSSGNVFADLGFTNPERELLRARLTLQIHRIMKKRRQTQAERKVRSAVPLRRVLERELEDEGVRPAYEQRRFHLQIAHLITDLRARRKLTQAEVARRARISQPMITRIERGDGRRIPTFDTIARLLTALGYTLSLQLEAIKSRRAA